MAAHVSGRGGDDGRSTGSGRRPWLRILMFALALLAASEAVWLWQTWPVRELLYAAPVAGSTASLR